jgi:hypothetical protein
MRIFLTGSQDLEWRWRISDFLREKQIDFFNSADYPREFFSIFKYFKILEGCDGVIACFSRLEPQHLQTVLEISYASKLAKEIMVIDEAQRKKSWIHCLPYSVSFPNLDGLKEHLTKAVSSPKKYPQLFG